MGTLKFAVVDEKEAKLDPYPYVHVEDDGSFRELYDHEKKYLEEKFYPTDGNRPYVKLRYKSKTPDGRLRGFCSRKKLPKGLVSGEKPIPRKWWQIWK